MPVHGRRRGTSVVSGSSTGVEHLVRSVVIGAVAWACLISFSSAIFAESPASEPPRYCTVFNHFTKSGGSSVKRQLVQSSRKEATRLPGLITGVLRTTPAMRLNTVHNASVIVGYGEMLRRPLEAAGRDCEYFTMLRDPIERLVSAFYYCPTDHDVQDRPSKWCGDAKGEREPLRDRLLEFATVEWGNRAFLLMMHSLLCDPKFELCEPELSREKELKPHNIDTREGWRLHSQIKGILSTYAAVGLFEEWELSMHLFNAKVKSPVRQWDSNVVANPGLQSGERKALLEWARANPEIHVALAADILLYSYGVAVFRKQIKENLLVEWSP